MPRLSKEKELQKEKEITTGYITCNTCLNKRKLYLFNRQIKSNKTYYKSNKCKVCLNGREPKPNKNTLSGQIREPKTLIIKSDIRLSLEAKQFIKRVIYMKGYIDSLESFKLAHHHINTFGFLDRLILDTEVELTIMFKELLQVYKIEKNYE